MIRLIVGLGNPTANYSATRHNAGFWFVDELADGHGVSFGNQPHFQGALAKVSCGESIFLFKPSTYMNRSGYAVGLIARYYKIDTDQIMVVHDELDFDVGVVRFKKAGGHGGHNGLRDIISHLGSNKFCRLRIGIGHPGNHRDVSNFVLQNPSAIEREAIHRAISSAIENLPTLIKGDHQAFMNNLHSK